MLHRLATLADRLRRDGFDVSASELIDAARALCAIDIGDRALVREVLRCTMVKERDDRGRFDAAFEHVFRATTASAADGASQERSPSTGSVTAGLPSGTGASAGDIDKDVLEALIGGDQAALAALAAQAVEAYAGIDEARGSERYLLHRVLRAIDLSRMLSAAMQQLRRDEALDDLELMLRRNEIVKGLEEFRRRLASEIASRLNDRQADGTIDIPERTAPEDLDLLALSRADYEQVRLALQPLLRRLSAKIGRKRRRHSYGRLDVRRTLRRSMQTGGTPIDVVMRRKHPHKPEVVVLCDVSGSVAEFAQFTFTIVNALHDELRNVRSFAFVDGVAEVSDVFAEARYEVAVNRLVERRGVVGLDGHSDYGAVFERFHRLHLDAVGSGTTLIITGDARGNYRDARVEEFERIAARARRVYWLNPEPRPMWGEDDSLIPDYRHCCTEVFEVRTLGQLADVVAELV
ncbi:MAG: VWA domain-containing protein [Acidobacteria bacterium]|nr:VWA domain-containing protein [Acidobacteriota bacterium]